MNTRTRTITSALTVFALAVGGVGIANASPSAMDTNFKPNFDMKIWADEPTDKELQEAFLELPADEQQKALNIDLDNPLAVLQLKSTFGDTDFGQMLGRVVSLPLEFIEWLRHFLFGNTSLPSSLDAAANTLHCDEEQGGIYVHHHSRPRDGEYYTITFDSKSNTGNDQATLYEGWVSERHHEINLVHPIPVTHQSELTITAFDSGIQPIEGVTHILDPDSISCP